MDLFTGNKIKLRPLEPNDLNYLYQIENDTNLWGLSGTITPYSKHLLTEYINHAHLSIYETKQLRLVIEKMNTQEICGLVDLYEFDPINLRAGIGIVINPNFQQKGFATEAIQLIKNYAFVTLNLHQLFAEIMETNTNSLQLFQKVGFECTGIKKDWIYYQQKFINIHTHQCFNKS